MIFEHHHNRINPLSTQIIETVFFPVITNLNRIISVKTISLENIPIVFLSSRKGSEIITGLYILNVIELNTGRFFPDPVPHPPASVSPWIRL
jgi:hypothetical protein